MEIRRLGRSALYVSEYTLGTMTFAQDGWGCDEAAARALVDRFLDAGGTSIDTADVYGTVNGTAEEICGRALGGRRSRVVLGTKCGLPMGPGQGERGASRQHVLRACEASLRRLGTDYLDLYWIHVDDPVVPLEETLAALDDLVRAGKVRYVGASNYRAYRLAKALDAADRLGKARFVAFQGEYSLIVRGLEREHFALLAGEGLGFMSWSPLGAGMLTGKITRDWTPQGARLSGRLLDVDRLHMNEHGFAVADGVRKAATELGCTPAQLALAWQRTRPLTSVIVGVRGLQQLEENLGALEVQIPPEIAARLEQVSRLPAEYPGDFLQFFWSWIRGGVPLAARGS
jgi:aryl-alcohol dehydrogenase-like predicted oxidoreductase